MACAGLSSRPSLPGLPDVRVVHRRAAKSLFPMLLLPPAVAGHILSLWRVGGLPPVNVCPGRPSAKTPSPQRARRNSETSSGRGATASSAVIVCVVLRTAPIACLCGLRIALQRRGIVITVAFVILARASHRMKNNRDSKICGHTKRQDQRCCCCFLCPPPFLVLLISHRELPTIPSP